MENKKKEFIFRGKTLEELKKLDVREFAKYLKADQRRYVLRNFDKIEKFVKKCKKNEEKGNPIKTHSREVIVIPQLVNKEIQIYNGRNFVKIKIKEGMLGHKLGEFVTTRKTVTHGAPGIGATRSSAALSVK